MERYVLDDLNVSCGSIRRMAREKLNGNWLLVFVGVALAYILSVGMVIFLSNCIPFGQINAQVNSYNNVGAFFRLIHEGPKPHNVSIIAYFYQIFISEIFLIGLASFFLKFIRKNEINPGHIFDGFEYYFKCLGLIIVQSIFIIGWSMLLLIPGIIKTFSYSQSYYILSEDPTKGILQCITESRQIMDGNKAKLFLLNLSFLGWGFLGMIPYTVIYYMVKPEAYSTSEFIVFLVCMLPAYVVYEYMHTSQAIFYNLITGFTKINKENSNTGFDESKYHFTDEMKSEPSESINASPESNNKTETENTVENNSDDLL